LWTAICIPFVILAKVVDRTGRNAHRWVRDGPEVFLKISRVTVEVEGLDNIDENAQYILSATTLQLLIFPPFIGG
jgi:hypothetical protein